MPRKKSGAPSSAKAKATRNAAASAKGIHDGVDKKVLVTHDLAHGPNMDDRSDVIGDTKTKSPKLPVPDTGDEGMEPGRGV